MNAMPVSPTDFIQDHIDGSDSDSNLDEGEDASEYYQPISAVEDDDGGDLYLSNAVEFDSRQLPNGHLILNPPEEVEIAMSSMRLNDDAELSNKDEEEEDDERCREEADSAVTRAFREDEDRRNAPLTTENAVRVMDAMRGVSFGGVAPGWSRQVSESDWIDQLRRLNDSDRQA